MIYENLNTKVHDVSKVAKLVYDVDFRTFDLFFSDENKAIKAIEKDLSKYKSSSIKVILDDNGDIIGMVECYVSKKLHSFSFSSLKLFLVDVLDFFVLCDVGEKDLYVAEIAIDESLRGQGLGRKVLLDIIDYARSKNMDRVILDVDFRNAGAKALYESLGFKEFNRKRVKIPGFERGMYNMELIL